MKRILDSVLPLGAPWGGTEYPSCFASLVMCLEHYDGSQPCWCARDLRVCRNCGECAGDLLYRKHGELYCVYMAVTGIGLGTAWSADLSPSTHRPSIPCREDETIAWSMRYAGYRYRVIDRDVQGDNRADLKTQIVAAIAAGTPVLAHALVGSDWSIITGYDDDGDTLIGWYENWYGREWEPAASHPDGYLENKMFYKKNGYDALSRIVLVEDKVQREMSYHEMFRNMITVLEREQANGYTVGFPAYEATISFLQDDERFGAADEATLHRMYVFAHCFIRTLAEARSIVGHIVSGGFLNDPDFKDLLGRLRNSVGKYLLDTHDICWEAWRAMGENHICEPEKYAERFRQPEVRRAVAEKIRRMAENDRRTLAELRDITR